MNRFQLQQMLNGVQADLQAAANKLNDMYADAKTTIEQRDEQKKLVQDLEEREAGLKAQIDKLDAEASAKLSKVGNAENSEKEKVIEAKAALIRNTLANKAIGSDIKNVLGDNTNGGEKTLPSTMLTELVTAPFAKNPLRDISTFTNIMNLEIPKIAFTLDDDDFLNSDSATAKELKSSASLIQFGRNKFKVFADVTETVLRGTDTNLVATVENALRSGMAKKEKKVAFASDSAATEASFYNKSNSTDYDIKAIEKSSLYLAIKAALADLEDDYSDNAKIVMKKSDYFDMIETLANGNATLYTAQPEQILGAPVVFCDLATIPVVGDFSYSHFNYDLDVTYESDKDIKTGVTCFVLTGYMDHKIKMLSAFRLATVTP